MNAAALVASAALLLVQPAPSTDPRPATAQPANSATIPAPRSDEGWVKRHESFNARANQSAEKGDIGIIFLGDSITQGWENHGKEVWAKVYAPRRAANFGIGGDRTQHVLWRIQNGNLDGLARPARGEPPKLAIVMIGTNNTHSDSAAQIADGITAVVHATREKLPRARILVLGVFPRSARPTDPVRAKIAEINTLASRVADEPDVAFLDISDKFLSSDGTLSTEIMPDLLHLSPKGYQVWADAIEPTVRELLEEAEHSRPTSPGPTSPTPRS
jgi:lysophospholipase L1-like esterase